MDWSPSDGIEIDSHWIELDQIDSDWIELDWIESEWIELDWIECEWIGLSVYRPVPVRTVPEVVYTVSPKLESGSSNSQEEHLRTNPLLGTGSKPVCAEFL